MSGVSHCLQESVVLARKQKGWSQRRLADEAEVAVETVRKIEGGRSSVTLAVLERVAEALEVSVVTLLGGDGGVLVGWRLLPEPERVLVQALVGYFSARADVGGDGYG